MGRRSRRRWLVEAVVGVVMLPVTAVPIYLYLTRTDDGYLMYLRGRYALAAPGTPQLGDEQLRLALAARKRLRELRGVPVLVYHGIGKSGTDTSDARFIVSRDGFAEQMRSLRAAGYEPVTAEQLALYLTSDPAADDLPATEILGLPAKPVLVTFDDGRTDALIQADTILRDTGMKATMFVIGKRAESGSFYYESIGDLAGRARSGRWELGNHTYDLHELLETGARSESALAQLEAGESLSSYRREVAADLDRAQTLLEDRTGRSPVAFAYPFGDWGAQAGAGVVEALEDLLEQRFEVAFDQDGQAEWRPALPGDDRMHVHRLQVMNWSGAELLARLEQGAERADVVYEERGLGYRYSRLELAYAAARTACAPVQEHPVRRRGDLGAQKLIALTFNGGPSAYTPQVLDLLERYGAAATFFVSGRKVEGHERLLRRMLVEGNEIANGTYSQTDLAGESDEGVAEEIVRTSDAVSDATGDEPCLVRPPFGSDADRVARIATEGGLTTALWSVDPGDYAAATPDAIADRVLEAAGPGEIVVLHDGGDQRRWLTVQALPRILETLTLAGYRFVTVSDLLAVPTPGACEAAGCSGREPGTGGPAGDDGVVLVSYDPASAGSVAQPPRSSAPPAKPPKVAPPPAASPSSPEPAEPAPSIPPADAAPPAAESPPPDGSSFSEDPAPPVEDGETVEASPPSGGDGAAAPPPEARPPAADPPGEPPASGQEGGSGDGGSPPDGSSLLGVPPGHGGTPPGQGGTPPGQSGTPPGQSGGHGGNGNGSGKK